MTDEPDGSERAAPRHTFVPLADYALLSDLHTGPLVSRWGSIDWLCFPDFDSPAVFAAILGGPEDGRWLLEIVDGEVVGRAYQGHSFTLETHWQTPTGAATVVDLLPTGDDCANLVRLVTCTQGTVTVRQDLRLRPDYARAGVWVRRDRLPCGASGVVAVAGPDMLVLRGPELVVAEGDRHDRAHVHGLAEEGEAGCTLVGDLDLHAGQREHWMLSWAKSYDEAPGPIDVDAALTGTREFWERWSDRLEIQARRDEMIRRSLLVLRALTHPRTGGIVAAPTASLPEQLGGTRNWDYRFTWLRDAALTIEALVYHGYTRGARLWRDWLLRAVAGDPHRLQIMYTIEGRRELPEVELDHLVGYEYSRPVRIGNGAADQYQADVVGEVMMALAALRDAGEAEDRYSWGLQKHLLQFCADHLDEPDHGIWEMRGDKAFFTHGRVMMWAAFNEGLRAIAAHAGDPDSCVRAQDDEIELWTRCRQTLHAEIHERGWNPRLQSFVQAYAPAPGFEEVDASLLQLPHTGFLEPGDERMLATVTRIEDHLIDEHGFVKRYRTESGMDGLEGDEHPFLICMGWLAEQYAATDRLADAERVLDLLDDCASDLGLFAEEFDPERRRLTGNYPQAFSHLGYVRAADAVDRAIRRDTR